MLFTITLMLIYNGKKKGQNEMKMYTLTQIGEPENFRLDQGCCFKR